MLLILGYDGGDGVVLIVLCRFERKKWNIMGIEVS